MDIQYIISIFPKLLSKLPLVLTIFLLSSFFILVVSTLLAAIRIKEVPILNELCLLFVSFGRSVPGVIHIFIVYYGLPVLFRGLNLDINGLGKEFFATLALILYQGSSVSEILRPSYLAIPKGQYEAAVSIGMSEWQASRRIIIPQMLPIALPSLGNATIDLMKYTSLLFLIGLADIMGQADILVTNSYGVYQLEIYVVVGIIYWTLSFLIGSLIKVLEKKVSSHLLYGG